MNPTFSQFNKETTITNEGVFKLTGNIPHIESLHFDDFIDVINNVSGDTSEIRITEKIDGNNLIFGYDNLGKFYTSREAKNGKRFYHVSEYANTAAELSFRNAHIILQSHPTLKHSVTNGFQVECEVLHGRQPNAIVYGENHVVFLRMLPGDAGVMPKGASFRQLQENVTGWKHSAQNSVMITEDGKSVTTVKSRKEWNLSNVSEIEVSTFNLKQLKEANQAFINWLNLPAAKELHNRDILNIKLNTLPIAERQAMKIRRELLETTCVSKKLKIKDIFLETMRSFQPSLRTVAVTEAEDCGIEGIVLLDEALNRQYKIVDKEIFTELNKFNFAVRNQIKGTSHVAKKHNQLLEFDQQYGADVYDRMLNFMATQHNVPGLDRYLTITKTLKEHKGDTILDTIQSVLEATNGNWDISRQIYDALDNLDTLRKQYLNKYTTLEHTLAHGKVVNYTESIHERTLMYFANVQDELDVMLYEIAGAQNDFERCGIVLAKQLKKIHTLT